MKRIGMNTLHSVRLITLIAFIVSAGITAFVGPVVFVRTHPMSMMNSIGSANSKGAITVHAAGRGNPWVNLGDGRDLPTGYTGAAKLQRVLEQNQARPLALASADFDEDGVPDLIGGYARPDGGIITLHRGNVDSIYPNAPEAQQRKANGTYTDSPFLSPARVFEVAEAADFVGAGDFDADSHWDVVAAARGGNALWLLPGDGHGSFGTARRIELPGEVTTLVTGEINRADGLADVVVGVVTADGPKALVFESPEGALQGKPEAFGLPADATALALGQLDDEYTMDLAVAAGHELMIVHGRDRKLSLDDIRQAEVSPATSERVSLPSAIKAMTLGDFSGNHRTEVALLLDEGGIHLLSREETNNKGQKTNGTTEKWKSALIAAGSWPQATHLVRAKVSSIPTDDLVLIDGSDHQLHILISEISVASGSDAKTNATSAAHATSGLRRVSASLNADGGPVAVLPMRLNVDALSDLVILKGGSNMPAMVLTPSSSTFTVNTAGDGSDCDPNDGICSTGTIDPQTGKCVLTGQCTLRAAIEQANASPGTDRIEFAVSSVTPTGPLPIITGGVTIDGTTSLEGRTELNGAQLIITAGNSTVRRLVINRSSGSGILLLTSGGNFIEDNFIGTNISGTAGLGNSIGVAISSSNNTIGGTVSAARNLISGNSDYGILISGSNATSNLVQGNFIGTDVNGTGSLQNVAGVIVASLNNTIGGTVSGARNLISSNSDYGILINGSGATGNLVQGNFIGTDINGTADLGNSQGMSIKDAPDNIIGGTSVRARNVLSGNNGHGIIISGSGATGNQIQGNFIGTDVTGTYDLGNDLGVSPSIGAQSTTIGGTTTHAGNVISGNRAGIVIFGSGSIVQGNFIGTDINGTADLGNSLEGVVIGAAANNTIGGSAGNTIAYNGGAGISIGGSVSAVGNAIRGNSIFSNTGLGIDLGGNGITPNDTGDGDAGANNLQNFPVLTGATSLGSISGRLNSRPNTSFRIEFFSNAACDSSGNGEGETFIGSTTVTTDSVGNVSFNASLSTFISDDRVITATATDPDNNTSEFSRCVPVSGTLLCQITCPSPEMANTGAGATQCGAVVNYPAPTTIGGCGSVTCLPRSGSFFTVGTTTVNCTTEFFGASCSFKVTVVDNTPPAISCPVSPITVVPTDPTGAVVTYATPVGTDNCSAATTTQTAGLPSGSIFPIGTTVNTFRVTDASGYTASCSFNVVVSRVPTIAPTTLTRVKGAPAKRSVIATVNDAETPAGNLTVVVINAPSFITVTNLTNNNGSVSADVAVTCAPVPGQYLVGLQVTDSDGQSRTSVLRVNVTEAALSYASPIPISFNAARVVTPDAPPEGFAGFAVSAPTFSGNLSVDQTTGVVSITRARPTGSHTITITATRFCGTILTRSFNLIVANGNTEYQGAVGEPIPPGTPEQGSKGSILLFNLYTSSGANENTRVTLSNRHLTLSAALHLFFVANDGSVSDTFRCLPADSSNTFLVSEVDPGSRGFLIAVAINRATGSPLSFNYLTGKADIWLASGHSATDVRADSFQALYPEGTSLPNDGNATINFDGVSYSRAARTLSLEDVPSPADGNNTILVFNRIGGNLASGISPIGGFRGVLYKKSAPESYSPFTASAGQARFFSALSDSFPLTTPSFSQLLSAGKDWRMVFHASNDIGLSGLALNRGPVKLNKSLLNPLALTRAASLTVPVFPVPVSTGCP